LAVNASNWHAVSASKSLMPLVALTAIFAVGLSVFSFHGVEASGATKLLWRFEFALILTSWVHVDRRVRGFSVPFEFDTFVFFAWPLVVPYYLYRSRGGRGLLFGAGICGLAIAPYLAAQLVHIALRR
jgi:hypothetical protein